MHAMNGFTKVFANKCFVFSVSTQKERQRTKPTLSMKYLAYDMQQSNKRSSERTFYKLNLWHAPYVFVCAICMDFSFVCANSVQEL